MSQQSIEKPGSPAVAATSPRVAVETNGINVIAEDERKGAPRQLFWPWFGANVSVLNGADGLSEIAAGLVSQGLTILDSVRKGMPGQPQGRTADNGQVVSGQVAKSEP